MVIPVESCWVKAPFTTSSVYHQHTKISWWYKKESCQMVFNVLAKYWDKYNEFWWYIYQWYHDAKVIDCMIYEWLLVLSPMSTMPYGKYQYWTRHWVFFYNLHCYNLHLQQHHVHNNNIVYVMCICISKPQHVGNTQTNFK